MEVYIDDIVINPTYDDHLEYLKKSFERMRSHQLRMNPLKCAFGVFAGNCFDFLVHRRGIETK